MFKALAFGIGLFGLAAPAGAAGFHVDIHAGVDGLSAGGEKATGATYGLGLGYDVERGSAFFGAELTADASDARDCDSDVAVPGDRGCVEARGDAALVGRIGAVLGTGTRLYLLAGYTTLDVRARYRAGTVRVRETVDLDGVRIGAGVEIGLSRKLTAKVEYRYSNYESDFSRHQALAGVSFRF